MKLETILKMEDSRRKFLLLEKNLLKIQWHGGDLVGSTGGMEKAVSDLQREKGRELKKTTSGRRACWWFSLIRADRKRLPAISPLCVLQWSRSGIVVTGAIDYCKGPGGAVKRGRGRSYL